ncbi:MAG: hypothetical protein AAGH41_10940 [Pseudomonadota bacterium]
MRNLFLSAAFLGLAACATGATGPDAAARFDRFTEVSTRDFTGYDQVFIAAPVAGEDIVKRIGVRIPGIRRDVRPLSQRDVDFMLGELNGELRGAVGSVATLVDAPGPGILTIRTILTDLDANRPTQIELAQEPGLSLQSLSAGDSSITLQFLEDGTLLAEARDTDNVVSLQDQGVIAAGIWTTARQHFRQVSNKVAALLS